MTKKERTATESMNVALARLESTLLMLEGFVGGEGPGLKLLANASEAAEECRNHLLTIQFHLSQLR